MPTAPLFYRPLLDAQFRATAVGDTTIGAASRTQPSFAYGVSSDTGKPAFAPRTEGGEALAKSDMGAAASGTLAGIASLLEGRVGSRLAQVGFSTDPSSYVASRALVALANHPELFDTASPDQAASIGANMVSQLARESGSRLAAYSGGALDISPDVTGVLAKAWKKQPVAVDEAVAVGYHVGRELERAVTPLPADAQTRLQWIEDATAETLALWPGTVSRTAAALGVTADAAKVEELAGQWRQLALTQGGNAGANRALGALLTLAGVDLARIEDRQRADAVLQQRPLDEVPGALATAIADNLKLAPDRTGWIAGRIVETGGEPGNVGGLAAELVALAKPTPGG